MTLSTERAFKYILFVWKNYEKNGDGFKKSDFINNSLPYLWFRFWWLASLYNFLRYSTLAILPPNKRLVLEFYLGDWCNLVKVRLAYSFIILLGPAFAIWLLLLMPLFQKLMSPDKRYRYWMKYFQLPAARSPDELDLVGCSKHKIAEFWRLAMFLQSQFLRVVTVQDIIMMSSFSASYITSMQKYYSLHSPIVFWGILMTNSLFLYAIALQTMLSLYLPLLYLFLTCRLLKQRLLRTTAKLKRLSGEWQFNPPKVDRYLHHFGTIVDEIQRCNFFWAKYLTLNYHISIFLLSICLLCAILSLKDPILLSTTGLVILLVYTTLAICFFVCGELHTTIKSTYHPLTRLMANKRLRLSANLRIASLLDFIMSEHAGFSCASLFLVRKQVSIDIPCHVVINTILLFSLIFFIFNSR